MRNSEWYADPTASKALNQQPEVKRVKTITAPKKKRAEKKEEQPKKIYYDAKPAYVAKRGW